jgi:chromosome segregation ATPase
MTDSPDAPQTRSFEPPPESYPYTPRWVIFLFVLLFALSGYLVYASYTQAAASKAALDAANRRADALATQLSRTNSSLAELKSEVQMTAQKLGLTEDELAHARSMAQQSLMSQKTTSEKLSKQIGQVQQQTASQIVEVTSDLNGTKNDVAATRKDLEDTKNQLKTAMGDLNVQSGLIASNHNEVEELKRLGERNIFEFNLTKTKSPQHVGPIQLQLRKADPKHYKYTLDVIADDRRIQKKDRTVEEPVQFYVRGAIVPYEIVVYQVAKNRITGYLSTPKAQASATAPSSQ